MTKDNLVHKARGFERFLNVSCSFVFPLHCSIFPTNLLFCSVNKRQNAGVLFACMELLL